jgi:hypothetical protein
MILVPNIIYQPDVAGVGASTEAVENRLPFR